MPGLSFTTVYNGLSGKLCNEVMVNAHGETSSKTQWNALWDTGATNTVITKKVIDELQLKPVSMCEAFTPQGKYVAYQYYVDVYLPNRVVINKLLVMEGKPMGCDVLVGMDIIGKGDFAVSNFDNKTTFSFRIPSETMIDFVNKSYKEPYKNTASTPGKNSPCPCGSGKKYKRCCDTTNT